MTSRIKIAAFEGYYGGSHRQWLDGLVRHSGHEIRVFTLPDRFWKWRMHGGSITLAKRFLDTGFLPDLILVTDMLDISLLLSMIRRRFPKIPVIAFFHENQLTYPWPDNDPDTETGRDNHYGFINLTSALVADRVVFNSNYHREVFLAALPGFLKQFPDHKNLWVTAEIEGKATSLPLGLDLAAFDAFPRTENVSPAILWNHRWEYDKQPEVFFEVLEKLSDEGCEFQLIVCGRSGEEVPSVFKSARDALSGHMIHWGNVSDFSAYARLLKRADIIPVTSKQDFFGISAVEAMYCGAYPLLPDRLAFPEHIPVYAREKHLYSDEDDLYLKLKALLQGSLPIECDANEWVAKYDWNAAGSKYSELFESVFNL